MRLGISCRAVVRKFGYEKAFRLIKESGFDAVDIGLGDYGQADAANDIYRSSDDQFESYFYKIKQLASGPS